jgi:hypothetical protein
VVDVPGDPLLDNFSRLRMIQAGVSDKHLLRILSDRWKLTVFQYSSVTIALLAEAKRQPPGIVGEQTGTATGLAW